FCAAAIPPRARLKYSKEQLLRWRRTQPWRSMRAEKEGYACDWKYHLAHREAIQERRRFFAARTCAATVLRRDYSDMLIKVGLVILAKAALAIGFGVLILALL